MPELNGYEATAAIRPDEGSDRHTPIIALTAGARSEDRERCLAEGMDGYLAKPVSKDALLAVVARSRAKWCLGQLGRGSRCSIREVVERLERLGAATGEDLMAQLAELFLADADERDRRLRDALEDGDAVSVSEVAHTMAGPAPTSARPTWRACARRSRRRTRGRRPDRRRSPGRNARDRTGTGPRALLGSPAVAA